MTHHFVALTESKFGVYEKKELATKVMASLYYYYLPAAIFMQIAAPPQVKLKPKTIIIMEE